jgi:hypothetical protein
MWIYDPKDFADADEHWMFKEGYMHCQKGRIKHALANVLAEPAPDALAQAIQFVEQEAGIQLSAAQFKEILSLYPFARAKLADYGWGDTEVREMVLDVVANVMANTRWPLGSDEVELGAFVAMLKKAAAFMGYETIEKATA